MFSKSLSEQDAPCQRSPGEFGDRQAWTPHYDRSTPLHFIANAASGSEDTDRVLDLIQARMHELARPYQLHRLRKGHGSHLLTAIRQAVDVAVNEKGCVVGVGGDGTLNSIVREVLGTNCPFAVIPQGTFNFFARNHDLPLELQEALDVLLREQPVPVQVGRINGQPFLVNASIGLYPRLLEDRETWKARFGRNRLIALLAGLKTLLSKRQPMQLTAVQDGQRHTQTALTIFVGNNRLQLENLGIAEAQAVEAGQLIVLWLTALKTWDLLKTIGKGISGRLSENEHIDVMVTQWLELTRSRRYRRHTPLKVAVDGETFWTKPPVIIDIAPEPLWLIRPPFGKTVE